MADDLKTKIQEATTNLATATMPKSMLDEVLAECRAEHSEALKKEAKAAMLDIVKLKLQVVEIRRKADEDAQAIDKQIAESIASVEALLS